MAKWKKIQPRQNTVAGTQEQLNIWAEIADQSRNLILDAKAGTGKTYTCIQSMQRIAAVSRLTRKKVGFCAFTASVGAELKKKVPSGMSGGTLHSFMFAVLRENCPNITVQLDKIRKLTDTLFPGQPWRRGERWVLIKLVSLCKNLGVTLDLIEDQKRFREFVDDLNLRFSLWNPSEGPGNHPTRAAKILEACTDLNRLTELGIDYDDMLWIPFVHHMKPVTPFDLLYIDEDQDINAIQQANALSLANRIIGVGDRNQAIFGFRGADTHAVDNLKALLAARPNTVHELPLTTCWRCPISGIELAQQLVPAIQPSPNAIQGEVSCISPSTVLKLAQPGDMILCRTNAPLIRSVYAFWQAKRPAYIRGRQEDGAQLKSLAEQIINRLSADSMTAFHRQLAEREAADTRRILQLPHHESRLITLQDRYACLRIIAENVDTITDLEQDLNTLFSDADPLVQVCHSSIHRAKGLEADNVFILEPHLLPHPRSIQDWEQQQERNIAYVAVTRFKQRLYFAGEIPPLFD